MIQSTEAEKVLRRLSGQKPTEKTARDVCSLLNRLIKHPEEIQTAEKEPRPNADIALLERSLGSAIHAQPIDEAKVTKLTIFGAFAQAESESISANVRWGKREAMRNGKAIIQYKRLYAFRKGADGRPELIPERGEVTLMIANDFLAGASLRMIQNKLESMHIPNARGEQGWTISAIRSILKDEKNCGDVLLQKTFISDCISKKVIRNTGQLPQYLIQNFHKGVYDRAKYDAIQAEFARRNAGRSPSKKNAPTGLTSYASKYALSERLVCGECGTLYRRCTWVSRGKKRTLWRCVSRLDYGTKYCHHSPRWTRNRSRTPSLRRSIPS